MDEKPDRDVQRPLTAAERRKAKLAAQLRANLQKRKAQARARRVDDPDQRKGGLETANPLPEGE